MIARCLQWHRSTIMNVAPVSFVFFFFFLQYYTLEIETAIEHYHMHQTKNNTAPERDNAVIQYITKIQISSCGYIVRYST